MRSINIYFENEEFESLLLNKGKMSWHDFILTNCATEQSIKGDSE